MNSNLIFDIGFHKGEDTRYYLYKGYNVIAVDACGKLISDGEKQFHEEVKSGRLILNQFAISSKDSPNLLFILVPTVYGILRIRK